MGGVKVFGVPVRLHFTFVLLLIFLLFVGVGDRQSGASTAIYVVALFGSVLLHEIGHTLVARHFGIRTLEIVMYPIGGVSRPERQPPARQELWIALAGPVVNFPDCGRSAGLDGGPPGISRVTRAGSTYGCKSRAAHCPREPGAVRLQPAAGLSHGRRSNSPIRARTEPAQEQATRIAAGAGQGMAILIGMLGLLSGNFMLVFVALFVYLGAFQEGAAARSRLLTAGYPVRAAMITDFRTLPHGATVRDAGELLLQTSQHDFAVMHGDATIGLLTRAALVRAMMSEGPEAYVAGIMDRDFVRFSPDTSLSDVMPQLQAAGGCALVMDEEDRLVGMLTNEHLSEFTLLRQAGMQENAGARD